MKPLPLLLSGLGLLSCAASPALAETTSYVALVDTALDNPVTHLLILEEDAAGEVHLAVHGSDIPSGTTTAIVHDPGFAPVRSLLLGLTEGQDDEGAPKTQLIAFLDRDFSAANLNRKWSEIFVGSRHSVTISHIIAAAGGDAAAQAHLTDEFYPGPAAGAAFATGGPFAIGEFTVQVIGGGSAINGNWTINSLTTGFLPGTPSGSRDAFFVTETAPDRGVFDINFSLGGSIVPAVSLQATNQTGAEWLRYVIELGTASPGNAFVPSSAGDGLFFASTTSFPILETSGSFPDVTIEEDRITFTGALADQASATFIAHVDYTSPPGAPTSFALRQYAVTDQPTTLEVVGRSGESLSLEAGNLLNGVDFHLRSSTTLLEFSPLDPPIDFSSLTPQPLVVPIDPATRPAEFFQVFPGTSP